MDAVARWSQNEQLMGDALWYRGCEAVHLEFDPGVLAAVPHTPWPAPVERWDGTPLEPTPAAPRARITITARNDERRHAAPDHDRRHPMTEPVFEHVDVAYPDDATTVDPGGQVVVTATVADPDAETVTFTVTLTAADGTETELASKDFVRSALTVDAVLRQMDHDAGWTLTRSTDHPARWVVTAPA